MTRHARLIGILGAVIALGAIIPDIALAADPVPIPDVVDPADPIGPTVIEVLANDEPGEAESRPLTVTAPRDTARRDRPDRRAERRVRPTGCFTGVNAFTYTITDGVSSQTGQIIVDVAQPANAPVTDTPQARFVRNSTMGKKVPVKLTWCGVLAKQASLRSYKVYQSTNGGGTFATTPIINSTATSSTRAVKTSTSYVWRVKTTDTKDSAIANSLTTKSGGSRRRARRSSTPRAGRPRPRESTRAARRRPSPRRAPGRPSP